LKLVQLLVRTKHGGGTSPSKVYVKRERKADFLLGEPSIEFDSNGSEVGLELLRRPKDDPGHPQTLGRFRIGGNVIDIDGFLCPDLASLEGLAIDDWIGLTGSDPEGIDSDGKEAEEGKTGLFLRHVDGIGIRKKGQPVFFGEFFQERFGLDGVRVEGAIPDFGELFEGERGAKTFGYMKMPVAGRNPAFLPIGPSRVLFDGRPDFLRRE